ncbi:MAG TPA: transporter substrate-binding domain-containing protein [Vicinamibacteria bacterium]|jgi:polar amino acid transport system substrate-binding protein|nr:transporter substrate-binding domain-containing protein [Vicinamibacteria bacterium]
MHHKNRVVITAIVVAVCATAACGTHPSVSPVAPDPVGQAATQVISRNAQCTIHGSDTARVRRGNPHPPAYLAQLAPDGILRVGVNYGNPNNASRDGSGTLHGVAIDLACVIAADLEADVAFIAYSGIPPLLRGFDQREWVLGFTASAPNLATAHPHIGVENSYLVPAGSPFQAVGDVDRPGVRVSVAQGNSPDLYLTTHLRSAVLLRFPTVPEALGALRQGAVQAFAGARDTEFGFLAQMPSGRVLPDDFATFYLGINVSPNSPAALGYLNGFVERAKHSGLIQEAINRAGLVGVTIPPPL